MLRPTRIFKESGIPIELGCSCKDDLAVSHKQCAVAEAWFTIKGTQVLQLFLYKVFSLSVFFLLQIHHYMLVAGVYHDLILWIVML